MERIIKVRTFLGQAIDTFKEYIKTKGNLQIDYSLEEYMQEILDYIDYLEKENQELKKQVKNCYCNRTDCSSRIKDSKKYDSLVQAQETQQKEFIKYLEDEINVQIQEESIGCEITNKRYILEEILKEYKSIIGVSNENN